MSLAPAFRRFPWLTRDDVEVLNALAESNGRQSALAFQKYLRDSSQRRAQQVSEDTIADTGKVDAWSAVAIASPWAAGGGRRRGRERDAEAV